jgi:hypothetical protein
MVSDQEAGPMSEADEVLRDAAGERLVTIAEVCAITGWKPGTIRNYLAPGNRAFDEKGRRDPTDFPGEVNRVWHHYTKRNGQHGARRSPVWRLCDITGYMDARGLEWHPLPGMSEVNSGLWPRWRICCPAMR